MPQANFEFNLRDLPGLTPKVVQQTELIKPWVGGNGVGSRAGTGGRVELVKWQNNKDSRNWEGNYRLDLVRNKTAN